MARQLLVNFLYTVDNTMCSIQMPSDQSLRQLRLSWGRETGKDPTAFFFRLHGADQLPEEGALSDVLPVGAFFLGIEVDPLRAVTVKVLGSAAAACRVPCHGLTAPENVIRALRHRLGPRAERPMRLIHRGTPLQPDIPLGRQGVPLDGELMADLQVTFCVRTVAAAAYEPFDEDDEEELDADEDEEEEEEFESDDDDDDDEWEDEEAAEVGDTDDEEEERRIDCFLSQPASCLLSERRPPTAQRLLSCGRVVRPQDTVLRCLGAADPLDAPALCRAVLELPMVVRVQRGSRLDAPVETRRVWPSDRVRTLLSDPRHAVFLDGAVPVDLSATFVQARVLNHMLLRIADSALPLTVRGPQGGRRVVQVDAGASLADLYARVRQLESGGGPGLTLWCDGEALPDEPWPLLRSGVDARSEVEVRRRSAPPPEVDPVAVKANAGDPRRRSDIGIQTPSRRKESSIQSDVRSNRTSTQTDIDKHSSSQPSTKADVSDGSVSRPSTEAGVSSSSIQKTENGKKLAATQAPPPAEFRIGCVDFDRPDFVFQLELPKTSGAVPVASLRQEVKRKVGRPVAMEQLRAKTPNGAEAFDGFGPFYVDASGREWHMDGVKKERKVELKDKDPPLVIPSGSELWIDVHPSS